MSAATPVAVHSDRERSMARPIAWLLALAVACTSVGAALAQSKPATPGTTESKPAAKTENDWRPPQSPEAQALAQPRSGRRECQSVARS